MKSKHYKPPLTVDQWFKDNVRLTGGAVQYVSTPRYADKFFRRFLDAEVVLPKSRVSDAAWRQLAFGKSFLPPKDWRKLSPEQQQAAVELATTTTMSLDEATTQTWRSSIYDASILKDPWQELNKLQADCGTWDDKLQLEVSETIDLQMRLRRFVEEAAELCQAAGLPFERFIYVATDAYNRPTGHVPQEVAGTVITLLTLANHLEVSVWDEAIKEFNRINTPEMISKIAAKQAVKAARGC